MRYRKPLCFPSQSAIAEKGATFDRIPEKGPHLVVGGATFWIKGPLFDGARSPCFAGREALWCHHFSGGPLFYEIGHSEVYNTKHSCPSTSTCHPTPLWRPKPLCTFCPTHGWSAALCVAPCLRRTLCVRILHRRRTR